MADNAGHYVHTNLGPKLTAAVNDTLDNSYDTTDLAIDRTGNSHSGSETSITLDVYYWNNHYAPANLYGYEVCIDGNSDPEECDHFHVAFHGDYIVELGYANDALALKAMACHETGHTVGLTHPSDAALPAVDSVDYFRCLQDPVTEIDHWPFQLMGAHNVEHVDATPHY
mgnify:CR=1 FL=1